MSNGVLWSDDDFGLARQMHKAGATFAEISLAVGRTVKAVQAKLYPNEQTVFGLQIPDAVLDQQLHHNSLEPRDLSAAFNGDPLPGYSALDRMRAQGRTI